MADSTVIVSSADATVVTYQTDATTIVSTDSTGPAGAAGTAFDPSDANSVLAMRWYL